MTPIDLIICLLLWLILFAGVGIIGRKRSGEQLQNEPEADPCDICLRWSECHGVDAETCPQHKEWRRV